MRNVRAVAAAAMLLCLGIAAHGEVATWEVATVHGRNQFTISQNNTQLLYNQQGWTDYVWYENGTSAPGTLATTVAGPNAPAVEARSGMKTYATTDVAVGQRLCDLKLVFEYHNTLGLYPSMNFFMTDGQGHYGIFSPASGGIGAISTTDILNGWTRMTLDLTSAAISDSVVCAVYEHNGLSDEYGIPFTSMTWGNIKNLTIAGMYDYQRSPTDGWGAWGTMFSQINHAGSSTLVNGYGLALIWGDTANSNNSYGLAQREIRNVTLSFGGTDYSGVFANATVPEPSSIIAIMGGLGSLLALRRRRA